MAAGSKNQDLAKEFLKIALSEQNDGALIKEAGWSPKNDAMQKYTVGQPAAEAAGPAAAKSGGTTPLIPEWAPVENPRTRSRPT